MQPKPKPLILAIKGMDCTEEVAILKRALSPILGSPDHLSFNVLAGQLTILPSAPPVPFEKLIEAIRNTGMDATPLDAPPPAPPTFWQRHSRLIFTLTSGVLTAIGFATQSRPIYALAVLAGIYYVLPKAFSALRALRPDMNLLMTIAVSGAAAIGEWFEAASVSFLFALSLTLESWSISRARNAIAELLNLTPPLVRRITATGAIEEVPPEAVTPGTRFQVRPGERIALDAIVRSGTSEINQAPITGESLPVPKEPGDTVYAGTVNGSGSLELESTKASSDTTLAGIIRLVSEAQQNRAPSEQWVDRFARIYTPAVIAIAAAVFLFPTLVLGQPYEHWLYQALVLLVIACPCALVISTPVSVVAALTAAARNGVLVKGGVHMEIPARLKAIAFDKTGTLTEGHPKVVSVVAMAGHTESELLERAAAMESHSSHPIARAILAYCRERDIQPLPAETFTLIPGKGATARWQNREYWLGSHRLLVERNQQTPAVEAELDALSRKGHTIVVIGNDQHVCGYIALADSLRPTAPATIESLRQAGIQHIVMLSGDNRGTAEAIGQAAGIQEIEAELLPEAKLAAISGLVERYQDVAMVGDGINDAPALSLATLGIAMGAAGSDAAIESADIALMSDDLSKIPWLIHHSRRMLSIIRTNIFLSLAIKAVFLVMTLLGQASLWAAITADMGTSLFVIFNALRLLRPSSQARRQVGIISADEESRIKA